MVPRVRPGSAAPTTAVCRKGEPELGKGYRYQGFVLLKPVTCSMGRSSDDRRIWVSWDANASVAVTTFFNAPSA